jgi:hypothetical protein
VVTRCRTLGKVYLIGQNLGRVFKTRLRHLCVHCKNMHSNKVAKLIVKNSAQTTFRFSPHRFRSLHCTNIERKFGEFASSGREIKSCSGRVFNSKFGSFCYAAMKAYGMRTAASRVKNLAQTTFRFSRRHFRSLRCTNIERKFGEFASNGRETKSCSGPVFNSKFGSFCYAAMKAHGMRTATSRVKNSAQA